MCKTRIGSLVIIHVVELAFKTPNAFRLVTMVGADQTSKEMVVLSLLSSHAICRLRVCMYTDSVGSHCPHRCSNVLQTNKTPLFTFTNDGAQREGYVGLRNILICLLQLPNQKNMHRHGRRFEYSHLYL